MLASTASRASTVVGVAASGETLAQALITLVRRGSIGHRRHQHHRLGLRGGPQSCFALSREPCHDTSSSNNSSSSSSSSSSSRAARSSGSTSSSSSQQRQQHQRRLMGSLGAATPVGTRTTLAMPEAVADGAKASQFTTTAAAPASALAGGCGTNSVSPVGEPSSRQAAGAESGAGGGATAGAAKEATAGAGDVATAEPTAAAATGTAATGTAAAGKAAGAVSGGSPPPVLLACHLPQPATGPLSSPVATGAGASCVLHNAFLDPRCDPARGGADACPPFTLLLLNYALPPLTLDLWDRAAYRVCADGGANRLAELVERCVADGNGINGINGNGNGNGDDAAAAALRRYLPDYITGDLDSLRPAVRAMYERSGIEVVEVADQDTTDLQKALNHIQARLRAQQQQPPGRRHTVAVMGALGGRLDHTVANLATLGRYPDLHVVLLGDGNSAQLVLPGRSIIRPVEGVEGPTCGLVPLFNGARVSSKGLRWDLSDDAMHMAGLVSTSNLLAAPQVEVHTDQPLVWTIELPH